MRRNLRSLHYKSFLSMQLARTNQARLGLVDSTAACNGLAGSAQLISSSNLSVDQQQHQTLKQQRCQVAAATSNSSCKATSPANIITSTPETTSEATTAPATTSRTKTSSSSLCSSSSNSTSTITSTTTTTNSFSAGSCTAQVASSSISSSTSSLSPSATRSAISSNQNQAASYESYVSNTSNSKRLAINNSNINAASNVSHCNLTTKINFRHKSRRRRRALQSRLMSGIRRFRVPNAPSNTTQFIIADHESVRPIFNDLSRSSSASKQQSNQLLQEDQEHLQLEDEEFTLQLQQPTPLQLHNKS